MKKYLMVIMILLFLFLIGCNTGDGGGDEQKPVINYANVSEVTDSIDILYSDLESIKYSDEEVQEEIARIRSLYDTLNDDEKALVNNYNNFMEIESNLEAYKKAEEEKAAEKLKVQNAVKAATEVALNAIPTKNTGETIELPNSYVSEDGIDVYIGWQTNDPETIAVNGVVTQPRNSTVRVTLTAICRSGDVKETVKKTVAVGPLGYTELPKQPVFAYYYGSGQTALTEVERKTINVINLSFGEIAEDGSVYVTTMNYAPVLQERKHGIRVMFSVQDKTGFQTWTADAAKRERLAQAFLDTCEKYHFDGVDIDWEFPVGNEVANYVEFMKLLYNKFKTKSRNYLITSAMYGGQGASKYNAGESCKYMDYVHLMTYDLNAPEKSTHLTALRTRSGAKEYPYYTNLSAESTVTHYIAQGVPKEKLVIGGAFYGKRYNLPAAGNEFLYQTPTQDPYTVTYRNIKNDFLSKIGANDPNIKVIREWDEYAEAPYLCIYFYNADGSVRERAFITYDDAESMKLKTQYVIDEGIGGIMFWQLSEEDRTSNDLVGAIYDAMNK